MVRDAIEYFLDEHKAMDEELARLEDLLRAASERKDKASLLKALESLLGMKQQFKKHFREEEKALFPPLEPHITSEGGAFMIMEHPSLMSAFNEISSMVAQGSSPGDLYKGGLALISLLIGHAERENMILHRLESVSTQTLKQRVWRELERLWEGPTSP